MAWSWFFKPSYIACHAALLIITVYWLSRVNHLVPSPCQDEELHFQQAQTYLAHRWREWDPKITTPPGLYLWSCLLLEALALVSGGSAKTSASALRTTNTIAFVLFYPLVVRSLLGSLWSVKRGEQDRTRRNGRDDGITHTLNHTALNLCLFPLTICFSALYYTDVMAALAVLNAFDAQLKIQANPRRCLVHRIRLWLGGLLSLLFRQTNIWWIAIFLGAHQAIHTVKSWSEECRASDPVEIVRRSWQEGEVYDPVVTED